MDGVDGERTTQLLLRLHAGEREVEGELLERLYVDLRSVARAYLSRESAGHTLQATALINEAYIKLIRSDVTGVETRRSFLGIAARAMRQILVDHARTKGRSKRGGDRLRITLDEMLEQQREQGLEILELNDALSKLATLHERKASVVELRFFGGMKHAEIADVLGVSVKTVESDWRMARAWLRAALE